LALAIGLVLGFSQDDGTVPPRALAVTFSIFEADLNYVRIVGHHVAFGDREAAIAGFHLDAVIGDAKTDSEPKSLGQPIGGCPRVGVYEYRNDNAGRHRTVESHLETLSLTPSGNPRLMIGGSMAAVVVNTPRCRSLRGFVIPPRLGHPIDRAKGDRHEPTAGMENGPCSFCHMRRGGDCCSGTNLHHFGKFH